MPQPKSAGVYYTISNGRMPSKTVTHVEAACKLQTNTGYKIHPFAFRVHTHELGTAVSGWKVSPDMKWTLLGKRDPQLPQMFYPIADNTTMTNGDRLATRCTMDNFKEHAVSYEARSNLILFYQLQFKVIIIQIITCTQLITFTGMDGIDS